MSKNGGRQQGDRRSSTQANGRRDSPTTGDGGILAALPRTRPQRSSPRRASAQAQDAKRPARPSGSKRRSQTTKETGAKPERTTKPQSATRKATTTKALPPRRREPPAPKQGYESQEESKLGATVHPPSGTELVESIATIFAELAGTGLKAGGRVLKDALSPLRRP
jgi:hypothetical protein